MSIHKTLDQLRTGEEARVIALPEEASIRQSLSRLGLVEGAHVRMTYNYGRSPVVFQVHGVRVILSREHARRIRVEPLSIPQRRAIPTRSSDAM